MRRTVEIYLNSFNNNILLYSFHGDTNITQVGCVFIGAGRRRRAARCRRPSRALFLKTSAHTPNSDQKTARPHFSPCYVLQTTRVILDCQPIILVCLGNISLL